MGRGARHGAACSAAPNHVRELEQRLRALESALERSHAAELPLEIEAERLANEIRLLQDAEYGATAANELVTPAQFEAEQRDAAQAPAEPDPIWIAGLAPEPDESEEDRIAREQLAAEERMRLAQVAAEAARAERERAETAQREEARQAAEAERVRIEEAERQRAAAERLMEERRLEQERLEKEEARLEAEAERVRVEEAERQRAEHERLMEEQRVEQERREDEWKRQRAEEARLEAEQARLEAEQARLEEAARIEREKREEAERIERERIEEEQRIERARLEEAERIEREKREEVERIERERIEEEQRVERARLEAEAQRKLEEEQRRKSEEFRRRVAGATPKIVMSAGGSNREAVTVNIEVANSLTPKRGEIAVLSSSWAHQSAPTTFQSRRKDGLYEERWPKRPRPASAPSWGVYQDTAGRTFACPGDPPSAEHAWIVISYDRTVGGAASTWQRFEVGGVGALWYVRQSAGDPIIVEATREADEEAA